MTHTPEEVAGGSRAYATYVGAVGWTTHDGRPCPGWFDLGPTVQSGWIAVGKQAADDVSRETSRCPDLVCVLIDEYEEGDGHSTPGYIDPTRLGEIVQGLKEEYGYGS